MAPTTKHAAIGTTTFQALEPVRFFAGSISPAVPSIFGILSGFRDLCFLGLEQGGKNAVFLLGCGGHFLVCISDLVFHDMLSNLVSPSSVPEGGLTHPAMLSKVCALR